MTDLPAASYAYAFGSPDGPGDPDCPCNSGRRFRQCCGAEGLPLAGIEQRGPEEILAAIRALREAGDAPGALHQLRTLTAIAPRFPAALELLAAWVREGPERAAALEPLRRLVELEPRSHTRHADLAGLYYDLRQLPQAETHARQALALNPLNPQAHNLMAMVYADSHHPEEAEFHYRQVLLLHEPVAPICANLANVLRRMGRLDEAEAFFRQALYLDPDNIEGLLSWVRMEEGRNDLARGWELLRRVPEGRRDYPGLYITRATLYRRNRQFQEALAELDALRARNPELAPGTAYFYERGQVLDGLGRYEEAFASFEKANQAVRAAGKRDYRAAEHRALADRLRACFTRDRVEAVRAAVTPAKPSEDIPSPIFIVGFPRSGTTMVEQMLSAHPHIAAGDELDYMFRLTQLAPHLCGSPLAYPECLQHLLAPERREALVRFRSYYVCNVELRRILRRGQRRFTDKMPLNETHLGLIHLVFPEAPVVHLIRHPLDVVLSAFFNDLTHGGNCSYDLVSAARHYALVFDLVRHYRAQLDLRYLPLRYEDLVDEPEPHLRSLLEFVGEPWDERCLAFHENVRYARTASYAQVKEPLYRRSRYRYRRYREQVEGIVPILRPAIEALGYEVD